MTETRSPSAAVKVLMPPKPGIDETSSTMRAASGSYSASTPSLRRERKTTTTCLPASMPTLLLLMGGPVFAQEWHELVGPLVGEEQLGPVELDDVCDARDGVAQPIRPRKVEELVGRSPYDQGRRPQLPE